jgi:HK97 family phage major capsid protein
MTTATLLGADGIRSAQLAELLEHRNGIDAEIKEIEARDELDEATEQRFDELIGEFELLNTSIDAKQAQSQRNARVEQLRSNKAKANSRFEPLKTQQVAEPGNQRSLDIVDHPDPQKYQMLRAINCLAGSKAVDGYEGEISQEIAHRSGKEATGFFMPLALRMDPSTVEERATLNIATTGVGALQTGTSNTMIGLLRNRMQITQLGATMMNNMVGDFDIPKQTASGSAYWVGEDTAPTTSNQTIGQVSFSPNTVGAYTDYTRRFTKQTSVDAEAFVRNDLNRVLALEFDRTAINGSGSGSEPEGILQNSTIPTVAIATNGGALTWGVVVDLETEVAVDNADVNSMAYLTNAKAAGHAKQTQKVSGEPRFILENNEMNGYQVAVSNQVPSDLTKGSGTALSAAIFGDFSTVFLATWGGVDVNVDPYSLSTKGSVRVVVLLDADLKFRHEESLAKIVDIVTT